MILATARLAWQRWVHAPVPIIIQALLDALFFITYGFLTQPLFDKLSEYSIIIAGIISKEASTLTQQYATKQSIFTTLLQNDAVRPYLGTFLLLVLLLALLTYTLYALLQGTSWWVASRAAEKTESPHIPTDWSGFTASFATISLPLFMLFAVYHVVALVSEMSLSAAQSINPAFSFSIASVIPTLFLIIIAYLAVASYGRWSFKKGVIAAVKQPSRWIATIAFLFIITVAINYISVGLAMINPTLGFVMTLVLLLAFFSYSRTFLLSETQ